MDSDEQQMIASISNTLGKEDSLPVGEVFDREKLLALLEISLKKLLEEDFNGLVNLMYRLDVREDRFRMALDSPQSENISLRLAELVLEREIERFMWRKRYSNR